MLALPIDIAKKKSVDLYELKVDGSRMSFNGINMLSDRDIIRNDRYPHIYEELKKLDWKIRGEVALGFQNNVLQLNKKENWPNANFYIFDLYEIGGVKIDQHSPSKVRNLIDKILKANNFKYIKAPKRFKSFQEGWVYVNKYKCEGVVLKDFDGVCWKVKRYTEEKLPIVGYEKGKAKGAFLINRNGVISKVSGTAICYVEAYFQLLKMGETPYVEIEYSFLTDEGKPFQPKLRRVGTLKNLLYNED